VYFQSILTFWLDLGVDGFHVRHSAYLYEDYDLRDDQSLSGNSASVRYGVHISHLLTLYLNTNDHFILTSA